MNVARQTEPRHHLTERQIRLRNRLIDLLKERKGQWVERDRIIFRCGFEAAKVDPLSIEFQNAIIRANEKLTRKGLKIVRSEDGAEIYSLQNMEYGNA